MDIGAWQATVYGIAESKMTEQLTTLLYAFNFKWYLDKSTQMYLA